MSSFALLDNPTATGLLGGLAVLAAMRIWDKVTGAKDEKSIPAQLAEINSKLASIDTTLQLIQRDAKHAEEAFQELKDEFRQHMAQFHSATPQHRTTHPS